MKQRKARKIAICHYRVGKTDGVSLEIAKRRKVLKQMGYKVNLVSGPDQNGADFVIPELGFDRADVVKIKKNAFFKFQDYVGEDDLMNDIYKIAEKIKNQFLEIHKKEKFDYLFLHNIFSHGRHISAAKAFYDFLKETGVEAIAVNHDFYESYKGLYTPRTPKIKKYLQTYVPPRLKRLKHATINSLSQEFLYKKIKQKSIIFPDTFEFNQKPWKQDSYNADFLETFNLKENDLIVLQATRIVERKGIELAIDLISELNKRKDELVGKRLYNGKLLDQSSDIVLVFGQFVEIASQEYKDRLVAKMKKCGVDYRFAGNRVAQERKRQKGKKIYSLWDAYVYADLISYPSFWEGFGNQFLEAIFAKKPIFLFEYPVFKVDIKKEGYGYVSLGDKIEKTKDLVRIAQSKLKKAADDTIKTLLDPKTKRLVDKNFQIGKMRHGGAELKRNLKKCLE